ncbi:hypothetical protein CYJ82_02520 [Lactobacillus crispatus]|nr:hypothetical protein CYJ82_02520 [Lactobacillus crispatus]
MQVTFGIDVSKSTSTVCELIGESKNELTITNNRPGFIQLLHELTAFSKHPQIIFEATGVYSRRLQAFLEDYGYEYVVINPLKAKKEMNMGLRYNKTDKTDAYHLALIQRLYRHPVNQSESVKIFRGIADIGYKATKKIYYYGFKVHAIVSDDGYLLDYAVTKASVHDAKETVELMINAHPINHYLLGDEGYLGKDLAAKLKRMGYVLWTPYRKNMRGAKKHNDHQLMAIRRTIESDFSLLSYYNAENNRARSLVGFQQRLEIAILAYNMAYCLERFN